VLGRLLLLLLCVCRLPAVPAALLPSSKPPLQLLRPCARSGLQLARREEAPDVPSSSSPEAALSVIGRGFVAAASPPPAAPRAACVASASSANKSAFCRRSSVLWTCAPALVVTRRATSLALVRSKERSCCDTSATACAFITPPTAACH
jgi:hypothetical protein